MTNLDRLVAETDDTPGVWEFGGESFTLAGKLDLRATVWLKRGEFDRVLTAALGTEQVDVLMGLDDPLDDVAFAGLMEAWAQASGTSTGESGASPRSSKSTAGPSKRTSNGSTKLR